MNARSFLSIVLCAASLNVLAGTPMEHRINAEAMPHQKLGAGDETVHYTRVRFQRNERIAADMLTRLRARIDRCVRDYKAIGKPVNPPTTWPDMTLEATNDTYWARNRTIQYRRYYHADVDPADCRLKELEEYNAYLVSEAGKCNMNLLAGTQRGKCDHAAHAAAPARPALRNGLPKGEMPQIPGLDRSNPQIAAALARLEKNMAAAKQPGQKKTVAGVPCESVALPTGGSHCRTLAGAMIAPAHFENLNNVGLILENMTAGGLHMKAEQAKFDTKVNAGVFTPVEKGIK